MAAAGNQDKRDRGRLMSVEIRVPSLGESVTEATVARWFKQVGDAVNADEPIVELETDKVTLEFNAPASGTLAEIVVEEGGEVEVGALLGSISEGAGAAGRGGRRPAEGRGPAARRPRPTAATATPGNGALSPAVRKLLEEHGLDPATITPSGPKGNLTKGDVLAAVEAKLRERAAPAERGSAEAGREAAGRGAARAGARRPEPAPAAAGARAGAAEARPAPRRRRRAGPRRPSASRPGARRSRPPPGAGAARAGGEREERVKMTRLRRRIAERLKEAQNTAAMLTTFNEADMTAVMALRQRYSESFEKKHGVAPRLHVVLRQGVRRGAAGVPGGQRRDRRRRDRLQALLRHRRRGRHAQGLVVPVVRDADQLGFAEIEKAIGDLGQQGARRQARGRRPDGRHLHDHQRRRLRLADVDADPQPAAVGILGMHAIQKRPVVVEDEIVIRPMMYLALSYDHRIVDGREAVSFLVRVKECIEDPERLLLDV